MDVWVIGMLRSVAAPNRRRLRPGASAQGAFPAALAGHRPFPIYHLPRSQGHAYHAVTGFCAVLWNVSDVLCAG